MFIFRRNSERNLVILVKNLPELTKRYKTGARAFICIYKSKVTKTLSLNKILQKTKFCYD